MKKITTLFFFLSLIIFGNAQNSTNATITTAAVVVPEVLELKQVNHDFGKIPQGKPVYFNFEIVNTGKEPLKLDNVAASCGCTTPEWSHDAIEPGATAIIKVGYNAANEGYFEKPITITYNTTQNKQLLIKGTVWKAPVGSAPANVSVQFLKQTNQ